MPSPELPESIFFTFQVQGRPYCLPSEGVDEVVPDLPVLRALQPAHPRGIIGYLAYRGTEISVVDGNFLLSGVPCRSILSTRILIVDVSGPGTPETEEPRWVGLRLECLLDYFELQCEAFDIPEMAQGERSARVFGQYTLCVRGINYECIEPRAYLAGL